MLGFFYLSALQIPPTPSNLITRSKLPKIRNYLGKNWVTISDQTWLTGRADKDPEESSYPQEMCIHSTPLLALSFWFSRNPVAFKR